MEGPRSGARVNQPVEIDRRGGVRVIDAPYSRPAPQRRRAPNHWERTAARSGHLYVPTPPPANPASIPPDAPPSAVFAAKTDPNWIEAPDAAPLESLPPAPQEPVIRLASMGRRVLSWVIDSATVFATGTVAFLLGLTVFGWSALDAAKGRGFDEVLDGLVIGRQLWVFALGLLVLISFVYVTLSQALSGMTLGQSLLRLHLETKDGEHPRLSDCAWRSGIGLCSFALGGLGGVWAMFDPQGLTLHDRLVGTRVIFTPPPPEETASDEPSATDESGPDPVGDHQG